MTPRLLLLDPEPGWASTQLKPKSKNQCRVHSQMLPLSPLLWDKFNCSAHFFLEGPLTSGGCWEGPPFSTELPRRQLCSPAAGEEESDWAVSQTAWKPCGWEREMDRYCRWADKQAERHRRTRRDRRVLAIEGLGRRSELSVMTLPNHANAPGWLLLMNISSPRGKVESGGGGGGDGSFRLLPEHAQSTWEGKSDKRSERRLTMGPGLPDPQGLHWLLTGEFLLAVETGAADYAS